MSEFPTPNERNVRKGDKLVAVDREGKMRLYDITEINDLGVAARHPIGGLTRREYRNSVIIAQDGRLFVGYHVQE